MAKSKKAKTVEPVTCWGILSDGVLCCNVYTGKPIVFDGNRAVRVELRIAPKKGASRGK